MDFVSPCPVQNCRNNAKTHNWVHHKCGGHGKITNQGNIYCIKCGTDGLFIEWRFNCGAHDFIYASAQGACYALAVMAQLDTKNQKFIQMLMIKVAKQFANFYQRQLIFN